MILFCSSSPTMATDPSFPSNSKTNPDSSNHQSTSSQSPESLPHSRRLEKRASSQPHEYTSLCDLLEFPCTCPLCTYVRQRREPGRQSEPVPQLADSLVTRLALAMLLPIPDPPPPPPRFQSERPQAPADASLEFLSRHVTTAISRAFERLFGANQATKDEEDASPCVRLPFSTC